jgi:hypothetical protein
MAHDNLPACPTVPVNNQNTDESQKPDENPVEITESRDLAEFPDYEDLSSDTRWKAKATAHTPADSVSTGVCSQISTLPMPIVKSPEDDGTSQDSGRDESENQPHDSQVSPCILISDVTGSRAKDLKEMSLTSSMSVRDSVSSVGGSPEDGGSESGDSTALSGTGDWDHSANPHTESDLEDESIVTLYSGEDEDEERDEPRLELELGSTADISISNPDANSSSNLHGFGDSGDGRGRHEEQDTNATPAPASISTSPEVRFPGSSEFPFNIISPYTASPSYIQSTLSAKAITKLQQYSGHSNSCFCCVSKRHMNPNSIGSVPMDLLLAEPESTESEVEETKRVLSFKSTPHCSIAKKSPRKFLVDTAQVHQLQKWIRTATPKKRSQAEVNQVRKKRFRSSPASAE